MLASLFVSKQNERVHFFDKYFDPREGFRTVKIEIFDWEKCRPVLMIKFLQNAAVKSLRLLLKKDA